MTDATAGPPAPAAAPAPGGEPEVANSAGRFARLPNRWINDDGLRDFRVVAKLRGETGAALKLYVAILLRAENKAREKAGPHQGSASLTYAELEDLTDLSRSMVAKGVKRLKAAGLVTVAAEGQGRKSRYFVAGYGAGDTYGRLPVARLYGQGSMTQVRFLHDLSLRNEADINALKIYLLLCAVYDRGRQGAMIGYALIERRTGISQSRIRRALSVLYEHGLVRAQAADAPEDGKNAPHIYRILGI